MTTSPLKFSILTLFPEMFEAFRHEGVISRGLKNGFISLQTHNLRDFSKDDRRNVDDRPSGGGDGMVLKVDVVDLALGHILGVSEGASQVPTDVGLIHLSPRGKVFHNGMARSLAEKKHIVFLCGRYAGFDERVLKKWRPMDVSIGDFVLSGGELPAMCCMDSISRFVPGVLGNQQSAVMDSFEDGFLEAPSYTQPRDYEGMTIPDELLSGDHKAAAAWRRRKQIQTTAANRPDLLMEKWETLSRSEKAMAEKIFKQGLSK